MNNLPTFVNAVRVQNSILTPLEKRVLSWLAQRLPAWVTPDLLTALGLIAMLMAGIGYAFSPSWVPLLLIVNVFIILNWFGDSLDGTVARVRNIQRPRYGFYVDHICDSFGALFIVIGLVISGYVSILPAIAALLGFYLLSIHSYLATYVNGVFKLSAWKLGPTELRVILICCNVYIFFNPDIMLFGRERLFLDLAGVVLAITMGLVLISTVAQTVLFLYKEETV